MHTDRRPQALEFTRGEDAPPNELSRRAFLSASAAALALGGAQACTRAPQEHIVPYRRQPAEIIPGRALHYASASTLDGYATGILVESHEGHPTKIEGNPLHPASLGASSAFEQALILELYDQNRLRGVTRAGQPSTFPSLRSELGRRADPALRGRGVHLVMPPTSSPLLVWQLERLRERLPELSLHFASALTRREAWQGAVMAFGSPLEARPDFSRAAVVVSLDADFLAFGPAHLAEARAFSDARRVQTRTDGMNRLYAIETSMSVTGGVADHRLALRPSELALFAAALLRAVARAVGERAIVVATDAAPLIAAFEQEHARFLSALVGDLTRHRGASVLLVGDRLPALVHAAGHAINRLLDNAGSSVHYAPSPIYRSEDPNYASLAQLANALGSRSVETLLVVECDIAYASPANLALSELLPLAKSSFYSGLFPNSTQNLATFVAPSAHVLESWLDSRAFDGSVSLIQPLVAPLYAGVSSSELLSILLGEPELSGHSLLQRYWGEREPAEFAAFWETTLAHGVHAGSAFAPVSTTQVSLDFLPELVSSLEPPHALELNLERDAHVLDGRFVDNAWLLELPDPVTKLTWGNAALIAPAFAARFTLENGRVLELQVRGERLAVPALVVPGHADHCVSLTLGWGQPGFGLGHGLGANAYRLLHTETGYFPPLHVERGARQEELALTQEVSELAEFEDAVLLHTTLAAFRATPNFGAKQRKVPLSLYAQAPPLTGHQWGMTIDLNACTGCSACVLACQAENNVPSVGASGVLKHREMHWLRVDRYVSQQNGAPRALLQPMACQHCEKAPCEYVCPTAATVHSSDGLNQMVYNRCVGTRFCSNNCPYKVRRFNWFDYRRGEVSPSELARNPEVTVRERGVMEKCTYCVQRVRKAEITARVAGRRLEERDVESACAQACPTRAIAFGDINDASSEVARLRKSPRAFAVLNELGTRPRTLYLAKLTNPNPELT